MSGDTTTRWTACPYALYSALLYYHVTAQQRVQSGVTHGVVDTSLDERHRSPSTVTRRHEHEQRPQVLWHLYQHVAHGAGLHEVHGAAVRLHGKQTVTTVTCDDDRYGRRRQAEAMAGLMTMEATVAMPQQDDDDDDSDETYAPPE